MPPLIRGLFLTKEQAEKLKEPFKDVVSVVRCKDCKYKECEGRDGLIVCDITGESHKPDFFCDDGEKGINTL